MFRATTTIGILGQLMAQAAIAQTPAEPPSPPSVAEAPPAPHWVRGAELELMVTREVNSRTAKVGDRFKLRVSAPVIIEGAVAIPVGSIAWGEVISVGGSGSAGGRGRLGARLLTVETRWGPVAITGTNGTEGKSNTAGVVLGVLGFGLLGLLNKGGNATFKAGDILKGYIAEGDAPIAAPLTIQG